MLGGGIIALFKLVILKPSSTRRHSLREATTLTVN